MIVMVSSFVSEYEIVDWLSLGGRAPTSPAAIFRHISTAVDTGPVPVLMG